jgi:hypothetical protein
MEISTLFHVRNTGSDHRSTLKQWKKMVQRQI